MEFIKHLAEKEIWFNVFYKDTDLIDQLAFIYLVSCKFRGKEVEASSIGSGKDMVYQINLRFTDWNLCSDAKAHCRDKIDSSGSVIASYRGALDNVDPLRSFANKMKVRAEKNVQN